MAVLFPILSLHLPNPAPLPWEQIIRLYTLGIFYAFLLAVSLAILSALTSTSPRLIDQAYFHGIPICNDGWRGEVCFQLSECFFFLISLQIIGHVFSHTMISLTCPH